MGEPKEKKIIAGETNENMCFVIMPIGGTETHSHEHFLHVYQDVFEPAIKSAGYVAKRADDDKSSSMIQVEIIKDIIHAPMAICDLSTRNPNVLFELGIRQAFDLPVVLVQEKGTPRIFDIGTFNTIEYRKDRIYHEVLEDRKKIEEAIKATKENKGINSIIKLLDIGRADLNTDSKLNEIDEIKLLLYSISKQINEKEDDTRKLHINETVSNKKRIIVKSPVSRINEMEEAIYRGDFTPNEIPAIGNTINRLRMSLRNSSYSIEEVLEYENRLNDIEEYLEKYVV